MPASRSRRCNASKCNDEVTGWLRRKRLDERAFLVRNAAILEVVVSDLPGPSVGSAPSPGRVPEPRPERAR